MKNFYRIVFISVLLANSFKIAQAIPPPDFIFNIGNQIVQAFTFLVLGFSIVAGFLKGFFEQHPFFNRHKKLLWILLAVIVVLASLGGAYAYSKYKQNVEYNKWIQQSAQQDQNKDPIDSNHTADQLKINELNSSSATPNSDSSTNSTYFDKNSSVPLAITNQDFSLIPSNAFVLDAREDEEYGIGNYPGSHHIRFADITSGDWTKLPTDQPIYVLCWSGIRGKEVAEFLRTKKILSRFVEKGADGWVTYGGKWNGNIKFRNVYTDDRYKVVFTKDQVVQYIQSGVVIVDSRDSDKYKRRHIPNSISIPIIYTPSSRMEEVLNQVPPHSTVITVCDDFVSCFDATVSGVKLEKKGHIFLGRYNKPWEF